MPMGTEMTAASRVMSTVPVMACRAPPPSPITLRMDWEKKGTSKRARPETTTVQASDMSGSSAITKAVATSEVTRRSIALREPSTRSEVR